MPEAVDWTAFADLRGDRPGAVVAVITNGVPHTRSFGSTEAGGPPLDGASPFYVASIAKQFTAACAAALIQLGALALDDPVTKWVPELVDLEQVQVGHLAAHTSGLPDSNALDSAAGFRVDSTFSTTDRIRALSGVRPESRPGTVHRYSNHGYVLLGEVVRRCVGEPLGQFARETLFDPAGMTNSTFLDVGVAPMVTGWRGGRDPVEIRFTCVGDGGLVTTLHDLVRWDEWLPRSEVADLVLGPRPAVGRLLAHDAWGVSIRSHHGQRIESHGGAIDGYLASFVRFPTLGWSLIALANTDEDGVRGFNDRMRQLADANLEPLLDTSRPPWTETHGHPAPERGDARQAGGLDDPHTLPPAGRPR